MPPPTHLKKDKEKNSKSVSGIDTSKSANSRSNILLKIHSMGIPPQPLHNFPLPLSSERLGEERERIAILCQSIHDPMFIERLNKTNFFDVRAHYRVGKVNEWLHLGEIYIYGAQREFCSHTNSFSSTGHAWITFDSKMVTGWHYCHGAAKTEGIPTFLLSIENYLMYVHLRIGLPLPLGVAIEGWSNSKVS